MCYQFLAPNEMGTHKPLVGSPNLPLGTEVDVKVLPVCGGLNSNEATFCYMWGLKTGDFNVYTKNSRPGDYHTLDAYGP